MEKMHFTLFVLFQGWGSGVTVRWLPQALQASCSSLSVPRIEGSLCIHQCALCSPVTPSQILFGGAMGIQTPKMWEEDSVVRAYLEDW